MTKEEYHNILVQKLEETRSDIGVWPPIIPGSYIPVVMHDEISEASIDANKHDIILAELQCLPGEPETTEYSERYERLMRILHTHAA